MSFLRAMSIIKPNVVENKILEYRKRKAQYSRSWPCKGSLLTGSEGGGSKCGADGMWHPSHPWSHELCESKINCSLFNRTKSGDTGHDVIL
jgi:hypothetical protein